MFNFKISINHNHIQKTEYVKYLGIYVDNKLSWKVQIGKLCSKISKVCGMIYKLRYFVLLSTLKVVYYSMFHSHLQYSLLNWGRSSKSYLQQLKILQNKVLRAILFRPKQFPTTLLYSNLNISKLDDMINMEFAKFMFKFNNKMLPESFDCYFTKLDNIHKHNTRQKHRNECYQFHTSSESRKKTLQYICLNVSKNIPKE